MLVNKNGSFKCHRAWKAGGDQCVIWYSFMKFLLVYYTDSEYFLMKRVTLCKITTHCAGDLADKPHP